MHVYVKSASLANCYMHGWVNYMDVLPLQDDGTPLPQPPVADYAMQRAIQVSFAVTCVTCVIYVTCDPLHTLRAIQVSFEWGYTQLSVQRGLYKAINERKDGISYREACDKVYMQVRAAIVTLRVRVGRQRRASCIIT